MVKAVYCSDSCDKEQRGCLLWNSILGSHAPQPRVTAKPVQLWYLVYNRCNSLGLCETIKLNIWWRTRQRLNHKQRNFARRCFWYKFRQLNTQRTSPGHKCHLACYENLTHYFQTSLWYSMSI